MSPLITYLYLCQNGKRQRYHTKSVAARGGNADTIVHNRLSARILSTEYMERNTTINLTIAIDSTLILFVFVALWTVLVWKLSRWSQSYTYYFRIKSKDSLNKEPDRPSSTTKEALCKPCAKSNLCPASRAKPKPEPKAQPKRRHVTFAKSKPNPKRGSRASSPNTRASSSNQSTARERRYTDLQFPPLPTHRTPADSSSEDENLRAFNRAREGVLSAAARRRQRQQQERAQTPTPFQGRPRRLTESGASSSHEIRPLTPEAREIIDQEWRRLQEEGRAPPGDTASFPSIFVWRRLQEESPSLLSAIQATSSSTQPQEEDRPAPDTQSEDSTPSHPSPSDFRDFRGPDIDNNYTDTEDDLDRVD